MKRKPYNLLLGAGLIFVLTSFFVLKHNAIDIQLHETYFVVAHAYVFRFLAILALFVWMLYVLTNKILYSKALVWTHVVITISTLLFFALTLFFGDVFINSTEGRYYDSGNWNSFDGYTAFMKSIGITILVLLFGQVIFVINVIAGLIKRLTNRKA